ncbi:MAG: efflux RND transporter periplasmic adaptor subunit, partial [Myxococcota bacterium]
MTSEASQGWRERLGRQALPALVGAFVGGALVAWGGSGEPAASESAPGEPAQAHPGHSHPAPSHSGHAHSGHAHSGQGVEDPTQAGSGWTCAMHPQVRQPEAGACPLCGMDLIPASSEAASEGPGRVALSPRAQALARLRVAPVRRRADGASTLRLLGRFETNERSERLVTAWTGGRIERLRVSATGERVRAGQVVATLYSPEVFAAHQDLRVAAQQVARLAGSPEATRRAADGALDAARDRLRLLGVAEGTLERMERAEQPTRSAPVRSPFAGTVMERLVSAGAYVTTGTPLLRVANLRSLWLQLDAYESDLGRLAVGQRVELTVDGLPGETFPGEVSFVDPTLDPVQR